MKEYILEPNLYQLFLDFIDKEKLFETRKKAIMNMSYEYITFDIGKLLGRQMTLKVEFDERRK